MPDLHALIAIAGGERNFICARIPTEAVGSAENRLLLTLFDLAAEHHLAMLELLDKGQRVGSALALARPIVEACYRLYWVASFNDGDRTQQALWDGKRSFKRFNDVIQAVEKHYGPMGLGGTFLPMKKNLPLLNGLTHGGLEQLRYRTYRKGEEPRLYPFMLVVDVLRVTTAHLCLAGSLLAQILLGSPEEEAPEAEEIAGRVPFIMTQLQGD